jgi:uncharacterized membrane protein YphA (DoxX/SURF4 family)
MDLIPKDALPMTSDLAWIGLRALAAWVYLWAFYRNVRDAPARAWTVSHTALMLRFLDEPTRRRVAPVLATAAMGMMVFGGLSILIGFEGRLGALLLLAFTAVGYYQHRCEYQEAMAIAERLRPFVREEGLPLLSELQWSAYAGHYSSALKNVALIGIGLWFLLAGTGPYTISDRLGALFR